MFGFPIVEHEQYSRNFLKSIIFQVSYSECTWISEKSGEIENLFKNDFPRFTASKAKEIAISIHGSSGKGANFHESEKGHVIQMRSIDGQKMINMTEDSLTLTISGAVYESFDKIKTNLDNIISSLELCNINVISKVAIRKINIIEFELLEEQIPLDVLGRLLNQHLMGNINFFPAKENVNNYMQTLNYNVDNKNLNLKYGLIIPNAKVHGQVIVDIDLVLKRQIELHEIGEEAIDINSEIFNIFNWILSKEAITILKN